MAHFFVSAAHKSSGKTTVTLGLLELLRRRGLVVAPCKKGPDYIDPIWLTLAAGQPCTNLDTFVASDEEVIEDFHSKNRNADLTVIEGNKGLYDGVALDGSNSNAAVAKLLQAPVILVIDCRGITRGIAPLLMGYQVFDENVQFGGVILNRVGGARHEAKLRASVEHFTSLPVLGAVHENPSLNIDEEHLGLIPGNEHGDTKTTISRIADAMADSVDLDQIISIANTAGTPPKTATLKPDSKDRGRFNGLKIGIARDEAFGFYYPGDLNRFEFYGAELVPFSPLHDKQLPQNLDAVFLGGGFPERHAKPLSANHTMLADVRQKLTDGLPAYAECGGLMYLSRSISWHDEKFAMAGCFEADAVMYEKPQGRGYVKLQANKHRLWPGTVSQQPVISAHEFHYSRLENLPETAVYGYDIERGMGIDGQHDGLVVGNLMASYTHMRHTNANPWVRNFLGFVAKHRQNKRPDSSFSSRKSVSCHSAINL